MEVRWMTAGERRPSFSFSHLFRDHEARVCILNPSTFSITLKEGAQNFSVYAGGAVVED